MSNSTGYPPKTAVELQDMDSQSRLRRKASSLTSETKEKTFSASGSDPIRAKLPYALENEAESLAQVDDDDAFDVISYWAMGASAWSVLDP